MVSSTQTQPKWTLEPQAGVFKVVWLSAAFFSPLGALPARADTTEEIAPITVDVVPGAPPTALIRPTDAAVAYLPVCRGVVWEQFDKELKSWVVGRPPPCGATEPAIVVETEPHQVTAPAALPSGTVVRPVVVVGTGCRANQPLPLAECARLWTVQGPTSTVRGRGTEAATGPQD